MAQEVIAVDRRFLVGATVQCIDAGHGRDAGLVKNRIYRIRWVGLVPKLGSQNSVYLGIRVEGINRTGGDMPDRPYDARRFVPA